MDWKKLNPPEEAVELFKLASSVTIANSTQELIDLACGGTTSDAFEVAYDVPGRGKYVEVNVARARNGVVANYSDPYMRRRDPNCLLVGDELPTDKERFRERYGADFSELRQGTFDWLKQQPLAAFAFVAGAPGIGLDTLAIVPANAGFFALGLAMLQGIIPLEALPADFSPRAIIYAAPIFRHTHFDGKQIVVHNRRSDLYEMFSYNLYPGPSAKKGVYGMLIDLGERHNWVTAHCSTVQVVTPYDNVVTIMHEGASGGGKSEMLERPHREPDGRMILGENMVTGEMRYLEIPRSCDLLPVTDDIALCPPNIQDDSGKLRVLDAENAWFVRVNHITNYGTDPQLERLTAQPDQPLLFLNIDAVASSRAMIWEHTHDAPGKPCPNPRVIVPRAIVPHVVDGPVTVDVRSFGVRMPACTKQNPSYGIVGLFHLLPPALAWLWRLVSPRGSDNPSIISSENMGSEGVGSYWPFAAGRRVTQANLLLDQFVTYKRTRHILCPNQHVGAWKVGFMPQWIAVHYLARRGSAKFKPDQLRKARSPLLGYTLHHLHIEGRMIARWFLQVDTQPEVGEQAYDQGAEILYAFFREYLQAFLEPDLAPLGKEIIACCLDSGTLEDYQDLIPME